MNNIIKTKNFELAIYSAGDMKAPRLALLLPGRLDTKDYAHMRSHVDFLSSKGYFALSFDPPGTWESPGEITLYTTQNYLKSIDELIEYLGNKPTVLMGHSRGGTIAMLAGPKNPPRQSTQPKVTRRDISSQKFNPAFPAGFDLKREETSSPAISHTCSIKFRFSLCESVPPKTR